MKRSELYVGREVWVIHSSRDKRITGRGRVLGPSVGYSNRQTRLQMLDKETGELKMRQLYNHETGEFYLSDQPLEMDYDNAVLISDQQWQQIKAEKEKLQAEIERKRELRRQIEEDATKILQGQGIELHDYEFSILTAWNEDENGGHASLSVIRFTHGGCEKILSILAATVKDDGPQEHSQKV